MMGGYVQFLQVQGLLEFPVSVNFDWEVLQ